VNVVIAAQGKSVLHREALERSCIRKENPVWNRTTGVYPTPEESTATLNAAQCTCLR